MEENQLPSVHHALTEAQQEPRGEDAMNTYTFRIRKPEKLEAEEICTRHGTTLAAFLRSCMLNLARDYRP